MNKKVFKTKDENGNELELAILNPSPQTQVDAQLAFNVAWRKAVEGGSVLRRNLDEIAEKRGLWDADKRARVENLDTSVLNLERKLRSGANSFSSLGEAKNAALEMRDLREERAKLIRPKLELDSFTCENFAELARTNYIIANTVVHNSDGKKYFKDLDDFITKSNSQVAVDSAISFFEFTVAENRDKDESYEETFLKKYKFVDSEGRLIDEKGRLVADNGKLINDKGRYINDKNEFVDVDGNLVDENGTYIIQFKEFDEFESEPSPKEIDGV